MKHNNWHNSLASSNFSNSFDSDGKKKSRAMIEHEIISYSQLENRKLKALWLSHPDLRDLPSVLPYFDRCACPENNKVILNTKKKKLIDFPEFCKIVLPHRPVDLLTYITRYYKRFESVYGQEPFYDVINADFCGSLCKRTAATIRSIFDYYVINNGGLLFLTVINKSRGNELTSGLDNIENYVRKIANDWELISLNGFPFNYKGNTKTMCSHGWKVNFKGKEKIYVYDTYNSREAGHCIA